MSNSIRFEFYNNFDIWYDLYQENGGDPNHIINMIMYVFKIRNHYRYGYRCSIKLKCEYLYGDECGNMYGDGCGNGNGFLYKYGYDDGLGDGYVEFGDGCLEEYKEGYLFINGDGTV